MTRDSFDMFNPPDRGRFGDNEYRSEQPERLKGGSKMHDLDLVLHHETERAILVSITGEQAKSIWLPKSQVEIDRHGKSADAIQRDGQRIVLPVVTVTIKEWLAKEKQLI